MKRYVIENVDGSFEGIVAIAVAIRTRLSYAEEPRAQTIFLDFPLSSSLYLIPNRRCAALQRAPNAVPQGVLCDATVSADHLGLVPRPPTYGGIRVLRHGARGRASTAHPLHPERLANAAPTPPRARPRVVLQGAGSGLPRPPPRGAGATLCFTHYRRPRARAPAPALPGRSAMARPQLAPRRIRDTPRTVRTPRPRSLGARIAASPRAQLRSHRPRARLVSGAALAARTLEAVARLHGVSRNFAELDGLPLTVEGSPSKNLIHRGRLAHDRRKRAI